MLYDKPLTEGVHSDLGLLKSDVEDARDSSQGWYPPVKLVMEWCFALVLLILTSPLLAVMAAVTKVISPGPAFYSQTRLGKGGKPFTIWKIRSMRMDSETKTGPVWATSDDWRVTRIGRFLRETHLDELPQLWNVLRGEMSIIGPRPERPEMIARIERSIPEYRQRLEVRPGLTGLAQVQLPPDSDMDDVRRKLAYDVYYIRRMSLLLDVRIAFCTMLHLSGICLNAVGRVLVKPCCNEIENDVRVRDLFTRSSRRAQSA